MKVDSENRSSFEQNKREMFDGMRAYHTSEQQHKRDAINFLKTIFAVVVGTYGAIFGSFITPKINFEHTSQLAWIIAIVTAVICWLVSSSAKEKIEADNLVYQAFGAEYTRFCQILGLDGEIEIKNQMIKGKNIDPSKPIGQGKGYLLTIKIINRSAWSIVIVSVLLAVVVSAVSS